MNLEGLRYSKTHEWASLSGDVCTIGITRFAAEQLQDITYIKLPNVRDILALDASFGEIETVKAVSDLYAPVAGEVVAVNSDVTADPNKLTADPFGGGWLIKVKVPAGTSLNHLMSNADYENQIKSSDH